MKFSICIAFTRSIVSSWDSNEFICYIDWLIVLFLLALFLLKSLFYNKKPSAKKKVLMLFSGIRFIYVIKMSLS